MLRDLKKVLLETCTNPFSTLLDAWGFSETASFLLEERAHNLGKIHIDDVLARVYRARAKKEAAEIRERFGLTQIDLLANETERWREIPDGVGYFFGSVSASFEIVSLESIPRQDFTLPEEFFVERDEREKVRSEWNRMRNRGHNL
ncbi:MAG: hypothetical protein V4436_00055 [Patescibacteria group bacterium]